MSVFWIILPIFTETWKEMATVFKGADNGKRRWCIQGLNAYQVLPLRETAVKETGKCSCYKNTVFTLDHSFISCRVRTTQLSDVELAKCSLGKFYITAQKPRALPSAHGQHCDLTGCGGSGEQPPFRKAALDSYLLDRLCPAQFW